MVMMMKLEAGAQSHFWVWGFAVFTTKLSLWWGGMLSITLILCRGQRSLVAEIFILAVYSTTAALLISRGIALMATTLGIPETDTSRSMLANGTLFWIALVYLRLIVFFGQNPGREFVAASGAYIGLLLSLSVALPSESVFYDPLSVAADTAIDVESTYYQQQDLVDLQLETIVDQQPGVVDMYFVGVAPFGGQDVFRREVYNAMYAVKKELIDEGRTATLINHRATLQTSPLANLPNIQRTLMGLSKKLDPSEDILFLFLTSHGNEDATLSADLESVLPNDLDADSLLAAIDMAGIQWRIIVVSACFSGSFIDPLRSPKTMIVTAASANRPSFGCEHQNEWTYFGEAFFGDGLKQTYRLEEAFDLASQAIRIRETSEGKQASMPQIFTGDEIARHLTSFYEARFPVASRSSLNPD